LALWPGHLALPLSLPGINPAAEVHDHLRRSLSLYGDARPTRAVPA
jgi:hypothetical protein